jgi:hypothetical protein
MKETEWNGSSDVRTMINYLEGNRSIPLSTRKLRLFACACVRRHWGRLRYPAPREAVEMAERFAEGIALLHEVEEMRQRVGVAEANAPDFERPLYHAAGVTLYEDALVAARSAQDMCRQQVVRDGAMEVVAGEDEPAITAKASADERKAQADLLR